jgi:hypothetical protein
MGPEPDRRRRDAPGIAASAHARRVIRAHAWRAGLSATVHLTPLLIRAGGVTCYSDRQGMNRPTGPSARLPFNSSLGSPRSSPETDPAVAGIQVASTRCPSRRNELDPREVKFFQPVRASSLPDALTPPSSPVDRGLDAPGAGLDQAT